MTGRERASRVKAALGGCCLAVAACHEMPSQFATADAQADVLPDASRYSGAVAGAGVYDRVAFTPAIVTGCDVSTCQLVSAGCIDHEVCGDAVDNDCNGDVDEGCQCAAGATRRCLAGPPGILAADGTTRGACGYGSQSCAATSEFGTWGACTGGGPVAEVCNGIDDNCNGCIDDGLCCALPASCPTAGDVRVPTGAPYARTTLRGSDFLAGGTSYAWHVEGGVCDRFAYAVSHRASFTLDGSEHADAGTASPLDVRGDTLGFVPTHPGDYVVTLTVARGSDVPFSCTFVLPVRAPGLWVEACWDTGGAGDVSPWLAQANATVRPANVPGTSLCTPADCTSDAHTGPDWGYADTPAAECTPPGAAHCPNPRLDATAGAASVSLDAPAPGDRFRVFMDRGATPATGEVHPIVTVYCGGAPSGTFGAIDRGGVHYGGVAVTGFSVPDASGTGSLWRVADVSDVRGATCVVDEVHLRGDPFGSCVTTGGARTFDGPCGSPP